MHKKVLLATVIVLGLAAAGYALRYWGNQADSAGNAARRRAIAAGGAEAAAVHVLLLGSDSGRFNGNTDTIMVASINPKSRVVSIMSIPRDSRVEIPRHGWKKINATNLLGGPGLAVTTVEELLGTWIDYYVLVDFKAAERVIDKLGGVTIDVPRRMDKDDPTQNLHIHLRPGKQHLNGERALQFARFRDDGLGDIGRTQRQQHLLKEMARQLLGSATMDRLPSLAPEVYRSVRTNATLADAVRLASWFRGNRDWTVLTMTLPGNFQTIRGISYWRIDPAKSRLAWSDLLKGRTRPYLDESLAERGSPAPATPLASGPVSRSAYAQPGPDADSPTAGTPPDPPQAEVPNSQPPDWLFESDPDTPPPTGADPRNETGAAGTVPDQVYGQPPQP